MNKDNLKPTSAFQAIKSIDYTVIIVRNMKAMRVFYEETLGFILHRELSPNWIEYQIGDSILALSNPGHTASDDPVPSGTAALQLAFKVTRPEVMHAQKSWSSKTLTWYHRQQIKILDTALCFFVTQMATYWKYMQKFSAPRPNYRQREHRQPKEHSKTKLALVR